MKLSVAKTPPPEGEHWDGYVSRLIVDALCPAEPDPALLISMAACLNHGFGLLDKKRQDEILHDMRKLWDEVVGRGYYSPAHRERYLTMLAKHQDAPTPEEEEAWNEMEKRQ